ncbi:MAG: hypothetical protein HYV68_02770, partial [Candidatus Taylorbacteria bacterium]|nr:hypothetical protein [Candidatus Taylorbacteria bacterium]
MNTATVVRLYKLGWLPALNRVVDDFQAGRKGNLCRDYYIARSWGMCALLALAMNVGASLASNTVPFVASTILFVLFLPGALVHFGRASVVAELVTDLFGHLIVLGSGPAFLKGDMSKALNDVLFSEAIEMDVTPRDDAQ